MNVFYIEIIGAKDKEGKTPFCLHWLQRHCNDHRQLSTVQDGQRFYIKAQHYHADIELTRARLENNEHIVVIGAPPWEAVKYA